MVDSIARNKSVVTAFLKAMETRDLGTIARCLAKDVVQHYQHPSNHNDDGTQHAALIQGRDNIVHEIGTYFYTLYREGTVSVTIQALVAEDDHVAARFILKAQTVRADELYENYYFFLYRLVDGEVAEYWEYLDSKYAAARLFGA